ncbi:MAG TPA: hypothetical protein VIA18_22245 [Polyangia bacterium]|jgi:hypothetical protein|nr:hypothetical protein [Polyangia bacterium]
MMCIGVVAMLVGCDASKDELESTKTTLATITSERDQLRTEVTTLQKQLDDSKAQLAKATAPPATPPPADAKHAATTPPAKAKSAHKS